MKSLKLGVYLVFGILGGIIITFAHAVGHLLFGDLSFFARAGVMGAGVLVFVSSTLVIVVLLNYIEE